MAKETEYEQVTLSLDDGKDVLCEVICIFEADGQDYIALLPTEGPGADGEEVYLYRYSENENGEPSLDNIESDDEYEIVSEAFDEELDAMQYDEIFGDDDEDNE